MIGLPKRTILSRAIHIRLDRKPSGVKVEKLKKKHYSELEDLRRKIARLANDIREHVRVLKATCLRTGPPITGSRFWRLPMPPLAASTRNGLPKRQRPPSR